MNIEITTDQLITEISSIISKTLPGFWYSVSKYKILGESMLAIQISANDYLINNVEGQRPQSVSLSLDLNTLELQPQVFSGNGGNHIFRKINPDDPSEKFLAMKSIKIPFRKPKYELQAIYRAIAKFCENYKTILIDNIEQLQYQQYVNYKTLLNK